MCRESDLSKVTVQWSRATAGPLGTNLRCHVLFAPTYFLPIFRERHYLIPAQISHSKEGQLLLQLRNTEHTRQLRPLECDKHCFVPCIVPFRFGFLVNKKNVWTQVVP